jgi:hemerythrin-like domain-containing protein
MRNENLIPLTHDHHHALAACRRLRLAAAEASARSAGARVFVDFFMTDGLMHFREEEEQLFPLVVGEEAAKSPLQKVMVEHLEIHAAVQDLAAEVSADALSANSMISLADLLEGHVRFEERVLFPLIESMVGDERLRELHLAPRDRNTAAN